MNRVPTICQSRLARMARNGPGVTLLFQANSLRWSETKKFSPGQRRFSRGIRTFAGRSQTKQPGEPHRQLYVALRRFSEYGKTVAPLLQGAAVPRLIVLRGVDEGKQFDLSGSAITVGRHSSNSVALHDTQVSRRHLELRSLQAGGYSVFDLGSGNGTLLNGQPVSSAPLRSG